MEELEDKKPNVKLENNAEWLDDPANKIWTLGKFFKVSKIPTRILEEFRCLLLQWQSLIPTKEVEK